MSTQIHQLTLDGFPAGSCDKDLFDLVVLEIKGGRTPSDVARELRLSGVEHVLLIVGNAVREVRARFP